VSKQLPSIILTAGCVDGDRLGAQNFCAIQKPLPDFVIGKRPREVAEVTCPLPQSIGRAAFVRLRVTPLHLRCAKGSAKRY
jgi:hypothetical protein